MEMRLLPIIKVNSFTRNIPKKPCYSFVSSVLSSRHFGYLLAVLIGYSVRYNPMHRVKGKIFAIFLDEFLSFQKKDGVSHLEAGSVVFFERIEVSVIDSHFY